MIGQRRGVSAFVPSDLTNTELWISASDELQSYTDAGTTPVSADGDLIYQINDRTTNGHNLVQDTSADRPLNKRNIVNGKAIARTDGINDYMTFGNILNDVLAGADKKFAVIISVANYATSGIIRLLLKIADGGLSENQRQLRFEIDDNKPSIIFFFDLDGDAIRQVQGTTLGGADSVITFDYDGSVDTNDGLDRLDIRVNGVSQSTNLSFTSGVLSDIPAGTAHLAIGAFVSSDGTQSHSWSAQDTGQLVVISDPSAQDISDVENFMIEDWNL
jgi:hypothetical protein